MTDLPMTQANEAPLGRDLDLRGNFDGVTPDGAVSGWCWSPDEPDVRRRILVELDGVTVGAITADQARHDLLEAGVGDGGHAFWGAIPEPARAPGAAAAVVLRDAATGRQIGGAAAIVWPGRAVAPSVPAPPTPFQGALDRVTRDGWVSGWCWYPTEPDERVELAIIVDDETVGTTRASSFRPDLQQARIGDGAHAFSYALPWSIMGSKGLMTISVRDVRSDRPLGDAITLRLGRMAATDERIDDLERQVRLLRSRLEELDARADPAGDDATAALFRMVGGFFQQLAEDVAAGREPGPAASLRGAIADVTGRYAPIALAAAPAVPEATVCIDGTASFDRLYRCVQALHAAQVDARAEIVVVDSVGQGEAALLPLVVRNLRLVHVAGGLLAARNEAAREARGSVLVFLAPEVDVAPGWLDDTLATFAREPGAAVVGSRVVRRDGTLVHAGLLADEGGILRPAGRGEDAAHPAFAYLRLVHALPDHAIAIRREAFEAAGGFATLYRTQLHATVELCLRLRDLGRLVLCQSAVSVRWTGDGGPDAARVAPDFSANDEDSRLLRHRAMPPGWDAEAAAGAARVRPVARALVIDTEPPHPDRDAGSIATLEQMLLLRRLGYHVTFACGDGQPPSAEDAHRLESHGIEVARSPVSTSVTEWLEQFGSWLDLVQVYRHGNAALFFERIRALAPQARIVFSPADLHFVREAREAALAGRDADAEVAHTRATELRCVAEADATILPSDFEVAVLAEHVSADKLVLLRWIARAVSPTVGFADRDGACFVGNFNHGPNSDGVLWFVRDVLPLVRAAIPGFRFHVAGSNMGAELRALASDSVVVHGWVPDLAPFFAGMRLSVAPLRYGAGFKGKIGTSLAHGLPAVATPVAMEGTGLAGGEGVLVGADAIAFAEAVVRLHEEAAEWAALSQRALAACEALFSPEAALEIYRTMLARLGLPAL